MSASSQPQERWLRIHEEYHRFLWDNVHTIVDSDDGVTLRILEPAVDEVLCLADRLSLGVGKARTISLAARDHEDQAQLVRAALRSDEEWLELTVFHAQHPYSKWIRLDVIARIKEVGEVSALPAGLAVVLYGDEAPDPDTRAVGNSAKKLRNIIRSSWTRREPET